MPEVKTLVRSRRNDPLQAWLATVIVFRYLPATPVANA